MFKRSFASRDRAGKAVKSTSGRKSFGEHAKMKLMESVGGIPAPVIPASAVTENLAQPRSGANSAVVTIAVGRDQRLFAAHEEVLTRSPILGKACRDLFFAGGTRRLDLVDEDPETFSMVLEFLYKDDYTPRLLYSKSRGYSLEGHPTHPEWSSGANPPEPSTTTMPSGAPPTLSRTRSHGHSSRAPRPTHPAAMLHHSLLDAPILRDTAAYCAGHRYGLPALQRLALRKQGLQSGIDVRTLLRSMRFAYANTPEQDSRLRAHFLALIVRARRTFTRSGTMQAEMTAGGAMFFDLFVALCHHLDDLEGGRCTSAGPSAWSPRTV